MTVNSISGDIAASTLQSFSNAAFLAKQAKGASATNDQPSSNQAVQQQTAADQNANNKVSPANKASTDTGSKGRYNQPARAMSHIVETYNLQGKVRIKYMDSRNNVIYQIPTEMVAKTQDLMANKQSATNIEG